MPRAAAPIRLAVPLADWSYSVRARVAPTHKRIIIRDEADGSTLWAQNWQTAGALQDGELYRWTYTAPRTRLSAVKTASLAGRAVTVELWSRRADGREIEDHTFSLTVG